MHALVGQAGEHACQVAAEVNLPADFQHCWEVVEALEWLQLGHALNGHLQAIGSVPLYCTNVSKKGQAKGQRHIFDVNSFRTWMPLWGFACLLCTAVWSFLKALQDVWGTWGNEEQGGLNHTEAIRQLE